MTADRTLYVYPWDIAGRVEDFVREAESLGINTLALAASYHAGKFLRPPRAGNSAGPRIVFPEDGALYFEPTQNRYRHLPPHPHSDANLRKLPAQLAANGKLALSAWTVLFHNSRLGAEFPALQARNAWGDGYVYSLCPMQPQVFGYGLDLCVDIAASGHWRSLILETPGWQPFAHGYHHEFYQVRGNVWLDTQLGLCFCDACRAAAKKEGIDADAVAGRVRARVDGYLSAPVDAAPDQAAAWLAADLFEDQELAAFVRLRQRRVTEFVSAVRAALPKQLRLYVIPSVQRPLAQCWLEGSDLKALAFAADALEVPFYEPDAARVLADASDVLRRVGDASRVRAILRPGPPDLGDGAQLPAAYHGLQTLGVRHIGFYNYGMLRTDKLANLASVLKK